MRRRRSALRRPRPDRAPARAGAAHPLRRCTGTSADLLQIACPGRPRPRDEPEVLAVPFVPGRDDVRRTVRRQAADPGVPGPGQERGQLRCGHALPRHRSLSRPFTLPAHLGAPGARRQDVVRRELVTRRAVGLGGEHSPPGVSYTTPLTILPTHQEPEGSWPRTITSRPETLDRHVSSPIGRPSLRRDALFPAGHDARAAQVRQRDAHVRQLCPGLSRSGDRRRPARRRLGRDPPQRPMGLAKRRLLRDAPHGAEGLHASAGRLPGTRSIPGAMPSKSATPFWPSACRACWTSSTPPAGRPTPTPSRCPGWRRWSAALAFDIALHDAYGIAQRRADVRDLLRPPYLQTDLAAFLTPAAGTDVSFAGTYPADFLV